MGKRRTGQRDVQRDEAGPQEVDRAYLKCALVTWRAAGVCRLVGASVSERAMTKSIGAACGAAVASANQGAYAPRSPRLGRESCAASIRICDVFGAHDLQTPKGIVHGALVAEVVLRDGDDLEARPLFVGEHVPDADRFAAAAHIANDFDDRIA